METTGRVRVARGSIRRVLRDPALLEAIDRLKGRRDGIDAAGPLARLTRREIALRLVGGRVRLAR